MSQILPELLKRANLIDAKAKAGSHADKTKQESLISEAEKMGIKADSATSATITLFGLLGPNRFNRFTSLSPNIAQYGYSNDEFAIMQGRPEPSILFAPMRAPAKGGASRKLIKRK